MGKQTIPSFEKSQSLALNMKHFFKQITKRYAFLTIVIVMFYLSQAVGSASEIKINTYDGNGGRVETATASYHEGRMYVEGRLEPNFYRNGRKIHVRIKVKDANGKLIATATGYGRPTGRPQAIRQFGVLYLVSFKSKQVEKAASIDVYY